MWLKDKIPNHLAFTMVIQISGAATRSTGLDGSLSQSEPTTHLSRQTSLHIDTAAGLYRLKLSGLFLNRDSLR